MQPSQINLLQHEFKVDLLASIGIGKKQSGHSP
jgi:hypothetical protein